MLQRGRKSAETLAMQALPEVFPQRPKPPRHLSKAEATVWRSAVGRMPATWFTPEMFPLLENHCCHVCMGRDLMIEIHEVKEELERLKEKSGGMDPDTLADVRRLIKVSRDHLHDLMARHLEQSKAAASLATKLRLTAQARYQPNTAGAIGPPPRKLPWEA
jgi:hypothetical protein